MRFDNSGKRVQSRRTHANYAISANKKVSDVTFTNEVGLSGRFNLWSRNTLDRKKS